MYWPHSLVSITWYERGNIGAKTGMTAVLDGREVLQPGKALDFMHSAVASALADGTPHQ